MKSAKSSIEDRKAGLEQVKAYLAKMHEPARVTLK